LTEHHPEETMAIVASDADRDDLPDELIDELLAGARTPEQITGPDGLLQRLTKRLVERAMAAELTEHLGYEHGEAPPGGAGNARNGMTPKTIHTGHGSVRVEQPRDRKGSFEPQIVPKHQRRFEGFDDKIIAMYGRGMSVRDIQAHLRELYGVEVGHDLISRVTDAVLEELAVADEEQAPLRLAHPLAQCLRMDAEIGSDVCDWTLTLERQPDATLEQLLGYFLGLDMTAENLLSPGQHPGSEVPAKPGPAQTCPLNRGNSTPLHQCVSGPLGDSPT
jgi:hypothetical protein